LLNMPLKYNEISLAQAPPLMVVYLPQALLLTFVKRARTIN
jgi:hypothetical protein